MEQFWLATNLALKPLSDRCLIYWFVPDRFTSFNIFTVGGSIRYSLRNTSIHPNMEDFAEFVHESFERREFEHKKEPMQ